MFGYHHQIECGAGGQREIAHLALFEVEGEGEYVSRMFTTRIFRRGGVGREPSVDRKRLEATASALGWTKPVVELVEPGWLGEEAY